SEKDLASRLAEGPDCQPCRFTGTAAAFVIGSYILYYTRGGFYASRPYQKLFMRIAAAGAYYMSTARFIYLPPFTHLAPTRHDGNRHNHS
ncbi:hypothetical protein Tcan_00373, partial [Toxocara canis]